MMRCRPSSLSASFFALLLSYLLIISLLSPFAIRRAAANPTSKKTAPTKAATATKKKGPRRDGELLIRFRNGVSEHSKDVLVASKGAKRSRKLKGRSGVEKLDIPNGVDLDALAAELRKNPAVEFAEPNFLVSRDDTTPNDARFAEQWALHNTGQTGGQAGADINASPAWDVTTGAQTTIIAVIDSGIDFTHPDLQNNQWTNSAEQQNGLDDDNNGLVDDVHGWDWITNSGVIKDEQGHGTIVAGIIASEGNNAIGMTGVMWKASLMSLRVLDNTGTGDVANAVEAIDYATDHGAQVINCSWGTDEESEALRDAIDRAGARGAVVVSSAGNSGRDIESEPYYPSSFGLPNQISVAATDSSDHLASFSNYGATHVTVAAPGVGILTTQMGGGYISVSGTSAATPLVSGIAGLVKTKRWWLSAPDTRTAIISGVRQVAELSGKVSSGGVVSASGALAALQGPDTPPPGYLNNGGGNGGTTPAQPPTPGYGTGGTGSGGSFNTTPPPTSNTAPGSSGYNLDQMRRTRPTPPHARAPIQADLCPDCDPGGGTPPSGGGSDPYFATARTRPQNRIGDPGVTLGSQNFNWAAPLVQLPGRAGLDLNLALVYNSLVWTRQGNGILFNADHGFPSPGFQLGVPRLETLYSNQDDVVTAYLLHMPSGERIQLKQVGTSNVYESQDSSYVQLIDNNMTLFGSGLVRTKDGTQYLFTFPQNVTLPRCTQIKDRNGNYITINYNTSGEITSLVDTLGRTVNFNYTNDYLSSITQTWNGQTHTWATFSYGNIYIQTNFPGLNYFGPSGYITVLTQVSLDDGSYYTFNYTSWGQVYKFTHYAPSNAVLSYTSYNLPQSNNVAESDCPRFTEQHDWATHWNNDQEVITYYSMDPNSAGGNQPAWSQVQTPDGTIYKELYSTASDWTKGLMTGTEVWINRAGVGYVKVRSTTTAWTQDDTTLSYQKNARPTDMSTYDELGNRRRRVIDYGPYAQYGLPYVVHEYAADASTVIRDTYTDYRLDSVYLNQHIFGLVSAVHVADQSGFVSKTTYDYDYGSPYLVGTPAAATQHDDTNYGAGFVYGRGNVTRVWKWEVTDINNVSKAIPQQTIGYNTTGSPVFIQDALSHQTSLSYTDSFSDGVNRNTFAYPTTTTDPDNYSSTKQYNYDFGATTRTQDPKGAAVSISYDAARRPLQVTNLVNNAYKRWVYADYQDYTLMFETVNDATEYYSFTWNDGAGRIHGAGGSLPNSAGGYFVQETVFDIMGRPVQVSNPTEITGGIVPAGDDATAGFVWTTQTYDWKGRPLVTTNPDGSTTELSYNVCGCAGSDTTTARDERGRRKQYTNDVLGRLVQVNELNWDQSVYATTTYSYNARDQITSINQAGMVRSFGYDGYGRQTSRTTPEQGQTTYSYYADGTPYVVTDARLATTTFTYNNRHLPTNISYGAPSGVTPTQAVTFGYDEDGNRTSMTDGLGSITYHYDQLSRMDWEDRTFNGLGTYHLSYGYNFSGELTSFTNPWGATVGYTLDYMGRANAVTGANYAGVSSYVGSIGYRAFGATKQITYGNSKQVTLGYDNRMRLTSWDTSGVLGNQYYYGYFGENSNRVTFTSNIYDHTMDHSYDYDQVGRLISAHTGVEARAHTGQGPWTTPDGLYSQDRSYDQWGNNTYRTGWGGWLGYGLSEGLSYSNNRLTINPETGVAMQYDASGNLTYDGVESFTYDVQGQQTYASSTGLSQSYDGDGLRVKKTESGATTYYLRSSVLGKQVVAELNSAGSWARGYVYLGGQLLAVQENGVEWVHQDPVTKSQRLTDINGNVTARVDVDPWGGETPWCCNFNQSMQPHRYTSYERDANSGDDAMMRRYAGKWQLFSQPDPFDGSYDQTDPQSFNRYAYTQNDPVNAVDPSGLEMCGAEYSFNECGGGGGFWGGNFGGNVAEYNREYGGLSPNVAAAMQLHNQRTYNAMGGYGYRTFDEVIRDLNFKIRYGYNDDGSLWTNFHIGMNIGSGSLLYQGGNDPDNYFFGMNTAINGGGIAASIGEYSNVINSSALGIHEWRGFNGLRNSLDWGGNGSTGARSLAVAKAGAWRAFGRTLFGLSVILSLYDVYQGGSKVKAFADITFSAIGTFGGPIGAIIALIYFGGSAIGWGKIINSLRPSSWAPKGLM
jgi:RHS repeat-associated protein